MQSLRILIVDDEEELGSIMAERLMLRGFQAEAALLEGRILVGSGRGVRAYDTLERMRHFRPTAKLWYQLRALMAMGRYDLAWKRAEELAARLGTGRQWAAVFALSPVYALATTTPAPRPPVAGLRCAVEQEHLLGHDRALHLQHHLHAAPAGLVPRPGSHG